MGLLLFDAFDDEAHAFASAARQRVVSGRRRERTVAGIRSAMIQELDPKDPDTTEVFNWNFRSHLADGDTVASVVGVAFPETDGQLATVGAPAVDEAGFIVSAKLGPCTKGRYYTARCRVTTTVLGETLDLSLRFYCDET